MERVREGLKFALQSTISHKNVFRPVHTPVRASACPRNRKLPRRNLRPQTMAYSTAIRPLLTLLTLIIPLQSLLDAPGAQPRPRNSQNGKSISPDRGGSFRAFKNFKHNVFFSRSRRSKLFSHSRTTQLCYTLGRILFGNHPCQHRLFNIIQIILQLPVKQYSVKHLSTASQKLIHRDPFPNQDLFPDWDNSRQIPILGKLWFRNALRSCGVLASTG